MQGPLRQELSKISTRARWHENLHWKCRRPRAWPAQSTCTCKSHFWKNASPQERDAQFARPAPSKCTWTSHKSIFCEKTPRPKVAGQTCASLHSRNGHRHLTRTILRKNLQQKCRKADGVPWTNPGLHSHRKHPSVCLGVKGCLLIFDQELVSYISILILTLARSVWKRASPRNPASITPRLPGTNTVPSPPGQKFASLGVTWHLRHMKFHEFFVTGRLLHKQHQPGQYTIRSWDPSKKIRAWWVLTQAIHSVDTTNATRRPEMTAWQSQE